MTLPKYEDQLGWYSLPHIFGEVSKYWGIIHGVSTLVQDSSAKIALDNPEMLTSYIAFTTGAVISFWAKRKERISEYKILEKRLNGVPKE